MDGLNRATVPSVADGASSRPLRGLTPSSGPARRATSPMIHAHHPRGFPKSACGAHVVRAASRTPNDQGRGPSLPPGFETSHPARQVLHRIYFPFPQSREYTPTQNTFTRVRFSKHPPQRDVSRSRRGKVPAPPEVFAGFSVRRSVDPSTTSRVPGIPRRKRSFLFSKHSSSPTPSGSPVTAHLMDRAHTGAAHRQPLHSGTSANSSLRPHAASAHIPHPIKQKHK